MTLKGSMSVCPECSKFLLTLCPEHTSYIIFEVGIPNASSGSRVLCTIFESLWPWLSSRIILSPILFEGGIPNLVFKYILGPQSFGVTVTLTSGLSSRIILSGAYLISFNIGISNIVSGAECCILILDHYKSMTLTICPLASVLEKICLEHISYIIWGRNPDTS